MTNKLPKVEKAKVELKEQLLLFKNKNGFMLTSIDFEDLRDKAQNLIDALEGGKNQEETKPVSNFLWQDLDTFPPQEEIVILRSKNFGGRWVPFFGYSDGCGDFQDLTGEFTYDMLPTEEGMEYIELYDLVDHIEKITNDMEQTKLDFEERLRKLEGKY